MALLEESKNNPLIDADESTINFIVRLGLDPDRFYIKPKPEEVAGNSKLSNLDEAFKQLSSQPGGGMNPKEQPAPGGGIPGLPELR
jgi:hypothetical protein